MQLVLEESSNMNQQLERDQLNAAILASQAEQERVRRKKQEEERSLSKSGDVKTFYSDSILISNENFIEAAQNIEPSAIREIFVETPKVEWSDIGGLSDVKEILEKVVIEPIKKNKFRNLINLLYRDR